MDDVENPHDMYEHDFRSYVSACYKESPQLYAPVWAVSIVAVVVVCRSDAREVVLGVNALTYIRDQGV